MEARVPGDGSEQISYAELASMVRQGLGLSLKELPERKLMAIWLALDQDNSGLISAGELGAFLRGGTGALAEAAGGEEAPIKPKLYFRPQSARAKRKEKAAPP